MNGALLVLDLNGYSQDYDINLDFWDGFVKAVELFIKKSN